MTTQWLENHNAISEAMASSGASTENRAALKKQSEISKIEAKKNSFLCGCYRKSG